MLILIAISSARSKSSATYLAHQTSEWQNHKTKTLPAPGTGGLDLQFVCCATAQCLSEEKQRRSLALSIDQSMALLLSMQYEKKKKTVSGWPTTYNERARILARHLIGPKIVTSTNAAVRCRWWSGHR